MKKGLTEIVCIIDRSGSMNGIKKEAEGSFNSFIEKQKKEPGEAMVTLAQFDGEYEILHDGTNIKDVGKYELLPRGMTALLDGIGKTVNTVGDRLSKTDESEKPENVVVCIVTDGGENASREFKPDDIKKIIETQEKEYSWEFIFLAANQDAFDTAQGLGIKMRNTTNFNPTGKGVQAAYATMDTFTSNLRSGVKGHALDDATKQE